MTEIIISLETATPVSGRAEVAIFNRELTAAEHMALAAAGPVNILDDPQDVYGWEEIYGPDQPLESVPLLQNGLVRARWQEGFNALGLEAFIPEAGYVEQGRVTFWVDDNGTLIQLATVVDARITEWTPERAAFKLVMSAKYIGTAYRAEVYVTLQRGWIGPRVEMYPSAKSATALGAHLRYSPNAVATPVALTKGTTPGEVWPVPGGAWAGNTLLFVAAEPWFALAGPDRTVYASITRAGDRVITYDDTAAYLGSTRRAFAVASAYGTAQAGYIGTQFGFGPAVAPAEAEDVRNTASGTTSVVADGTASGSAVEDAQAAETANTLRDTAPPLAVGKYGIWARVRVVNAGATGSFRAALGGVSGSVVTTTSTAFTWIYLGELSYDGLNPFSVSAWRSAGTGAVRIDRVEFVPLEMRAAANPSYDGARDHGQAALYDTRPQPQQVPR